MPKLQKEFNDFHDSIKLGTYEENITLREKRDMLIDELKNGLKDEKVPDTNKSLTFSTFGQGSYAMNTGIYPPNNDYDIDVGIVFDITNNEFGPVKLKKLIRDKLTRSNRTIQIRRPCITVKYEDGYHVDLAVYANNSGDYHIAWAKEFSSDNSWEKSEPKKLINWVNNISSDTNQKAQYRRCVRYLKAWKENQFSTNGNAKPPSIGLTIQARYSFSNQADNDLDALIGIVSYIRNSFFDIHHEETNTMKKSIIANLPVAPFSDVYQKMTLIQTNFFYAKIDGMLEALKTARDEEDAHKASNVLRKVFGDEFPLVEKVTARTSVVVPFITTGNNA